MPVGRVGGRGGQASHLAVQALAQRARAEQCGARGGELQRQREPIQVRGQSVRAAQRRFPLGPSRAGRLGTFEQKNRSSADRAPVSGVDRQWLKHEPVLTGDADSHPAGDQQGQARARIQQSCEQRRRIRQKMLQVVQDQQHLPGPQGREQHLSRVPPGLLPDAQGVRQRRGQGRGLGQAGQRHPGHTIGVQPARLRLGPSNLHHQPGLPDPARAEDRDQPDPWPGHQRTDTSDVVLPPDQGVTRGRHRRARRQPPGGATRPGQHVLVCSLHLLTRVGAKLVAQNSTDPLVSR